MQDKTTFGISDELCQYIEAMVEEVALQGKSFEKQKKYLKIICETDGVDYNELEDGLSALFDGFEDLRTNESTSAERLVKMLAPVCLISKEKIEDIINKIVHNRSTIVGGNNDDSEVQQLDRHLVINRDGYVSCNGLLSVERLVVPSTINNIVVKGINNFKKQSKLKEVILPNTLETILSRAFEHCISLENIIIPDGVKSIASGAFSDCVSLKNIAFPKSVTEIGHSAFCNCTSLERVSMRDYVKSVNSMTFAGCHSLKDIVLSASLRKIESDAFESCQSLESIKIPLFVREIDENAFGKCKSLNEVIVEGPTTIDNNAFSGCYKLEKIIILNRQAKYKDFAGEYHFDKYSSFSNCNAKVIMGF